MTLPRSYSSFCSWAFVHIKPPHLGYCPSQKSLIFQEAFLIAGCKSPFTSLPHSYAPGSTVCSYTYCLAVLYWWLPDNYPWFISTLKTVFYMVAQRWCSQIALSSCCLFGTSTLEMSIFFLWASSRINIYSLIPGDIFKRKTNKQIYFDVIVLIFYFCLYFLEY